MGSVEANGGTCRTLVNINYFNQAQSVALTVFGITAGILMRFTHHYKIILIVGLAIRLLCVTLPLPPLSLTDLDLRARTAVLA